MMSGNMVKNTEKGCPSHHLKGNLEVNGNQQMITVYCEWLLLQEMMMMIDDDNDYCQKNYLIERINTHSQL